MNRYNLENFDHEYYRRTVSKVSYIFVAVLSSTFISINLYILLISKAGNASVNSGIAHPPGTPPGICNVSVPGGRALVTYKIYPGTGIV